MTFSFIPPGRFLMGSYHPEAFPEEKPVEEIIGAPPFFVPGGCIVLFGQVSCFLVKGLGLHEVIRLSFHSSILPKVSHEFSIPQILWSVCVHVDRIAGGDRHHRNPHRASSAGGAEGPRGCRSRLV
jgi:hypothetical protein